MENSYIEVEQLLFGYSNGHHLLETSIILDERTQKKLEVLSDLSGPDIQPGFTEYITGYPLENERYYALCKTWYAHEMKRPGCVWTHMLLFKYEDLGKIKNCRNILDLFSRPNIKADNYNYSESIKVRYFNDNRRDLNVSIDKLKFIEWSIYANNEPIIISADTTTEYLYEIYIFWVNQDEIFMRSFSFCTGVLSNRSIEKKVIDLQVVPYSLLRSIARQNKQVKILDVLPEDIKYPSWVDYMINDYIMDEFNIFRRCFSNKYFCRQYFQKLASLYIETGVIDNKARLREFLDFSSNIFLEEDATLIQNSILQHLLKGKCLKWFNYNSIIDVILDLSINIELSTLDINNIYINEIIDLVWSDYSNEVRYILEKLINARINILGEELIRGLAHKASPHQLPEFTNMDLGLCNLMIKLDNRLALCLEIWNQTRDFQLEILNCVEVYDENIAIEKQILLTILENTSFDLCDSLYAKFGDLAISTFLDWYCITRVFDDKKIKWIKICKKNPSECLKWMQQADKLKDIDLIIRIISVLDPYSDEVIRIDKSFWIDIFYCINIDDLSDNYTFILAQFFIPIILLKKELFPKDIVRFSFNIINNRIAEQKFDYQKWEKLERLLPEVAWYNSWDKCKRLRKAIKQKGYKI